MLNTNLDTFVTPDLAFFAPLDAVGSFADEQFCVWNGMIGSAPAHPVLTNVIEWMVNLVSSRGDMYDIERMVCRFSGMDKIENWKVRAEPSLMLTGPCALGLAVNNALGNEPLAKLRPGLLKQKRTNDDEIQSSNQDAIGNVMILLVSSQMSCAGIRLHYLYLRLSIHISTLSSRLTKMILVTFGSVIQREVS